MANPATPFTDADAAELARLEAAFEEAGGRGVELAERIDQLRARRQERSDNAYDLIHGWEEVQ